MLWQVQEAKQRFSELLRAVQSDGPQIVTRHGEEIAVVIDIAEFHRLRGDGADLTDVLLGQPVPVVDALIAATAGCMA